MVGFLRSTSATGSADLVAAFRQGLSEAGFLEGQNVAIDYRWGDVSTIACGSWRPISCAGRWPLSSAMLSRRGSSWR